MAELDPGQEAVLRRLRAAFGFVEVRRVVDHQVGQDDEEPLEEGEQASPADQDGQLVGGSLGR
jgi:hypothetical protein